MFCLQGSGDSHGVGDRPAGFSTCMTWGKLLRFSNTPQGKKNHVTLKILLVPLCEY